MSTLALSQLLHGTPALLHKLGDRIHAFLAGIEQARAMSERFQTLSRMSDYELARRGLRRDEIPRAVMASTRP
jgi:hypothetical protein